MEEILSDIIGTNSDDINWWQMCIRGVVVFMFTLLVIRFGDNRIFGKNTAFDIALGIILGSILSRAITGNAPFLPVLATSLVVVFAHRLLAALACYTNIGRIVKGRETQLVKNGEFIRDKMNKHNITENDIEEAMRSKGKTRTLEEVEAAYLERSGDISIISKK